MVTTTDICIIGGGPAGCVLAARLAQFGFGVCLVERAEFPRRHLGESLSPGVLPLLASIGAGPTVEQAGYPRVRKVHVRWEKEVEREDPEGQGMLVDRGHFDRLLLEHARGCGVRVFQPANVEALRRRAGGWSLAVSGPNSWKPEARFNPPNPAGSPAASPPFGMEERVGERRCRAWPDGSPPSPALPPLVPRGGREESWATTLEVHGKGGSTLIEARLIADATGRAGVLPRRRRRTGPRTIALYAYWSGDGLPRQPQIEAGADAWFWGVPLPDGLYNTLVFLDPRDLRRMPGTLEDLFLNLLSTSSLLPSGNSAQLVGKVQVTDATPYLDDDCVTENSIKVGDAALAIDPLSSSGVQKAIQSALAASVVVNTLLNRPQAQALAQRFYRESLGESSARHRAWACVHYDRVAAVRSSRFWRERADTAPESEAIIPAPGATVPADARLELPPGVEFVETPCVVDRFIQARPAVRAAGLDSPVAYVGGVELAPLLKCVRRGMTFRELLQSWLPRVPPAKGLAVLQWLTSRRLLVPVQTIERSGA